MLIRNHTQKRVHATEHEIIVRGISVALEKRLAAEQMIES